MKTEVITYQYDGKTFKGYLSYNDEIKGVRPCVLVAHAWKGQDDFARKKADALADLGYIGFAIDLFGNGKTVESDEEAGAMIAPLFGFCFGGLSVLELFKSGAKLKGTVSFHGLLGKRLGDMMAKVPPSAIELHGSILVLHGHLDPLVSEKDIKEFESEMTYAGVDWQMHVYGTATHAFSNPNANKGDELHMRYDLDKGELK